MYNNYYYNYDDKRRHYQFLKEVVDTGIQLMRQNPSEQMFVAWLEYSRRVLELSSKDDIQNLQVQSYASLVYLLQSQQLPPFEKLSRCIDFLINVMRYSF